MILIYSQNCSHFSFHTEDEVALPENEEWHKADVDYMSSTTGMHAVWPTLKHVLFEWAVIEDDVLFEGLKDELAPREPCQHPRVLQCGTTG